MRRLLFLGLWIPALVLAESTPTGFWQSYDLHKNIRNIIEITNQNGTLTGTITKVKPYKGENPLCYACKEEWHNKPLLGLPIIWGLQKEGNKWINGHVLDIDDGKIYNCELTVSNDDKVLYFRGYSGIPTFGVTVQWTRVSGSRQPYAMGDS